MGSVVFDSSIQLDDGSVLLYVLNKDDVKKYIFDTEDRTMIWEVNDEDKIQELSKKYSSWKKFYSSRLKALARKEPTLIKQHTKDRAELLHRQKLKDRAELLHRQKLKDRAELLHRQKLEEMGVSYIGIRSNSTKIHRVTHCYDCKQGLDSTINLECMSCGWILCKCGACGCGWPNQ